MIRELSDKIYALDNLHQVVSEYTMLQPCANGWRGDCPLCRQGQCLHVRALEWKCLSCFKKGRVIDFIVEVENVERKEAIELLSQRYLKTVIDKPSAPAGDVKRDMERPTIESLKKQRDEGTLSGTGSALLTLLERRANDMTFSKSDTEKHSAQKKPTCSRVSQIHMTERDILEANRLARELSMRTNGI